MPLESLGPLLEKYRSLRPPNDAIRKATCEAIQSTIGIRITTSQVVLRRGTIYVDVSSHTKMLIHTNQEVINKRMKALLGSRGQQEIR